MTMALDPTAAWLLSQEARALLSRLDRVRSLALQETMVPAAAPSPAALSAIESFLVHGRNELRRRVLGYLAWLASPQGSAATPAEAHRRYTFLRLRFNSALTQFDIFSEAMSQRSEAETGVWLAGLDIAAQDALALPGYIDPPPIICYLARDMGGAIRRARARLPGGGENPVALIRLPRERMIGSGVASSLVHEVGHQAAELLDLLPALRTALTPHPRDRGLEPLVWRSWRRWISEIVADLWAVARVGVASTLGLIALVSLPRAFVFKPNEDDPHPTPWLRVKLSCALGDALYPHPQWKRLAQMWESFYPLDDLSGPRRAFIRAIEASIPRFVGRLLEHRADRLGGSALGQVLPMAERRPARLAALWRSWQASPHLLRAAPPSAVFAALGQARMDGTITPEHEGNSLAELLKHWALRTTLDRARACAGLPGPQRRVIARAARGEIRLTV